MQIDNSFVKKYDALINDRLDKAGLTGDMFDTVKSRIWERVMTSDSYDPDKGKISTWLWNICRSVISNEKKKASRSQDVLDHGELLSLDQAQVFIGSEDAGTAEDELARVFRRASSISQRDKEIVKDHYLKQMTVPEVVDKYGMEKRAVEQVIYRAMQALRKSVAED